MTHLGFITSSLSRGLALEGIAALEAQGDRFAARLGGIHCQHVKTKKQLRQAVEALIRLGEATHLVQVVGRTPNERYALISQFVPHIVAVDHGIDRKELRFYLMQTELSVRRGVADGDDCGDVLAVDGHAVERLFLRLQTAQLPTVADELWDALLFALPLAEVAARLQLQQIALPTSSGAFLCDYDLEQYLVRAKTWLAAGAMGSRWTPVCSLVRNVIEEFGGANALASLLGAGVKQTIAQSDCGLFEALTTALSNVAWLKEKYSPRSDRVGEMWQAARRQAAV
jgi:hypothetical protein